MTRTAHRSDTGRQPRRRLALAFAVALWASAATAQAADDGMIVIPGRGETTESALAHVAAASPRTPGAASAAYGAPAQAGVTAAGSPGAMPAANPRAPAPAAYPATASRDHAAGRTSDPNQIVTVVAGTPAASAAVAARLPAPRNGAADASAPAAAPGQQDGEAIRHAAATFLQQQTAGLPGKTTVSVAAAFPRGLAACTTLEPFLPTGARVWGRTTVGVRCAGERPWTLYLQAKVSIHATYFLASRSIAPGELLSAADLMARDGDLTMLPQAVITDPAQVVGSVALMRVSAGLPLRRDMLKSADAVTIGQSVKVIAQGQGFAISSEGSAMNNASPGQPVRVKTANGQIIQGIVKDGGTVEIQL